MKRQKKRAAVYAVFLYLILTGFLCGILKAAQTTRKTLYGGEPVMAQLTEALPADTGAPSRSITLGGGEWKIPLPAAGSVQMISEQAESLPPCALTALLRLCVLTDRFAAQTAEWISGAK